MLKKISKFIFITLILSNCSKEFHETKLLLPPNFDKLPIIEDKTEAVTQQETMQDQKPQNKISKQDINDIKNLLLD